MLCFSAEFAGVDKLRADCAARKVLRSANKKNPTMSASVESPMDKKNVFSFFIPNESPTTTSAQERKKPATRTKTLSAEKKETKVRHTPSMISTNVSPTASTATTSSQNKVWKVLFSNLNRAIDELYEMCEEEEDIQICSDSMNIFEGSSRDFRKLIERIESQKRFSVGTNKSVSWEVRTKRVAVESKLNAGALPFSPTINKLKLDYIQKQEQHSKPVSSGIQSVSSNSNNSSVVTGGHIEKQSSKNAVVGMQQKLNPTQESLNRFSIPPTGASMVKTNSSNTVNKYVPPETDDEANEVELEQESVWANAEALVEAELQAEELAWDALIAADSGSPTNSSLAFPATPTSPARRISIDTDVVSTGSPPSSATSSEKKSPQRRSLHDKLSSPDRKKKSQLSPEQMMQLQMAKHSAAETNRDQTIAERRMKAGIVSSRVKAVEEMKARKKKNAEKLLENRLEGAERRHEDHLNLIRDKAGNENKKVNEVMFINTLNEAALGEQLQRQLNEVEERIRACRERRQNRLDVISDNNKHKNSKKAQQMSSLRLNLETQRAERWGKLQQRIEAVQSRREARLQEVARRQKLYQTTLQQQAAADNDKENNETIKNASPDRVKSPPCGLLNVQGDKTIEKVDGDSPDDQLSKSKKKKKKQKRSNGKMVSVQEDEGGFSFPSLEESNNAGKSILDGNENQSDESLLGFADPSFAFAVHSIREVKTANAKIFINDLNVSSMDAVGAGFKNTDLLEACDQVSKIHAYFSKNLHHMKASKSVNKRTADVIKYFVESFGPILATPSTSSSYQKILRQFYVKFVPLFSSALTYECLNLTKSNTVSTQNLKQSKFLLVVLSRILLDAYEGGICNKETIIQLLKTKALACISSLLSTCNETLINSSHIVPCLVDTIHLIAHSVVLCRAGEFSDVPVELLFATLVDLLEPFNNFFANGADKSDYKRQVICYINLMMTSSSAIKDVLDDIRLSLSSLSFEKQKVAFDLTKSFVKYLHFGISSFENMTQANIAMLLSSLLCAILLTSEVLSIESLSDNKPDMIRLSGIIIHDINRLSRGNESVLKQLACSEEFAPSIFSAIQRILVLVVYTDHVGDVESVKQAATDSYHCMENLFRMITCVAYECDSVHQHCGSCLKFLCNLPAVFHTSARFTATLYPAIIACSYRSPHNMRILRTEVDPSRVANFLRDHMSLKENDSQRTNLSAVIPPEKWEDIMLVYRDSEGVYEGIDTSVD